MSREIKFRAFDKIKKQMHSVNSIWGFTNIDHITVPNKGSIDTLFNNFELMKFTGLTDKNGVDVYEGDVLKWISATGEIFHNVVYFLKYRYRIKGTKNKKTFHSDFNENQIFNHKCEIIGNIHENPEFL